MADPKATTMELPVKLVRQIAILSFETQREAVKERVNFVAQCINDQRTLTNGKFLPKHGLLKPLPLYDLVTIYTEWKELYLAGKMDYYHPAHDYFHKSKTTWWKRLRQFSQLPEADDDKTIRMAMEDLDLIDYTFFLPKVTAAQE
jgi:hypothetical protein